MTTVLTVDPLLWGPLALARPWAMSKVCGGYSCTRGNTQVRVPASSSVLNPNGIDNDTRNLHEQITRYAGPEPVIVFGWSRGAQVIGQWLRSYADRGPAPDLLSFVLIGNPERGVEHGGNTGRY